MSHVPRPPDLLPILKAHCALYAETFRLIHVLDIRDPEYALDRSAYQGRILRTESLTASSLGAPRRLVGALTTDAEMFQRLATPGGRRVFVAGDGGIGKSEWCRNLAFRFATLEPELGEWPRIPLYAELKRLRFRSEGRDERRWQPLLSEVLLDPLNRCLAASPAALEYLARHGRIACILDGVDEIPPDDRARFALQLESLLEEQFAQNVVIVAGRRSTLTDDFARLFPRHLVYEPDAFDEYAVARYIDAYFANRGPECGRALKSAIATRGTLASLMTNPLMLALACQLMAARESMLPDDSVSFLNVALERLLHRRKRHLLLDPSDVLDALARLAFAVAQTGTLTLDLAATDAILGSFMEKRRPPEMNYRRIDLLDNLIENSGVIHPNLRDANRGIEFVNQAIVDFLAARHIATLPDVEVRTLYSNCVWSTDGPLTRWVMMYLWRRRPELAGQLTAWLLGHLVPRGPAGLPHGCMPGEGGRQHAGRDMDDLHGTLRVRLVSALCAAGALPEAVLAHVPGTNGVRSLQKRLLALLPPEELVSDFGWDMVIPELGPALYEPYGRWILDQFRAGKFTQTDKLLLAVAPSHREGACDAILEGLSPLRDDGERYLQAAERAFPAMAELAPASPRVCSALLQARRETLSPRADVYESICRALTRLDPMHYAEVARELRTWVGDGDDVPVCMGSATSDWHWSSVFAATARALMAVAPDERKRVGTLLHARLNAQSPFENLASLAIGVMEAGNAEASRDGLVTAIAAFPYAALAFPENDHAINSLCAAVRAIAPNDPRVRDALSTCIRAQRDAWCFGKLLSALEPPISPGILVDAIACLSAADDATDFWRLAASLIDLNEGPSIRDLLVARAKAQSEAMATTAISLLAEISADEAWFRPTLAECFRRAQDAKPLAELASLIAHNTPQFDPPLVRLLYSRGMLGVLRNLWGRRTVFIGERDALEARAARMLWRTTVHDLISEAADSRGAGSQHNPTGPAKPAKTATPAFAIVMRDQPSPGLDDRLFPGEYDVDSDDLRVLVEYLRESGKIGHANILQSMLSLRELHYATHQRLLIEIGGEEEIYAAVVFCHYLVRREEVKDERTEEDDAIIEVLLERWDGFTAERPPLRQMLPRSDESSSGGTGTAGYEWPYAKGGFTTRKCWLRQRQQLTQTGFVKFGPSTRQALRELYSDLRINAKNLESDL